MSKKQNSQSKSEQLEALGLDQIAILYAAKYEDIRTTLQAKLAALEAERETLFVALKAIELDLRSKGFNPPRITARTSVQSLPEIYGWIDSVVSGDADDLPAESSIIDEET